jgi:hypothetical protein
MKYLTVENGDRPFMVDISEDGYKVEIYKRSRPLASESDEDVERDIENMNGWDQLVCSYDNCLSVLVAQGITEEPIPPYNTIPDDYMDGSCLLIRISNSKYVFVGGCVYEFNYQGEFNSLYARTYSDINVFPYAISKDGQVFLFFERKTFAPGTLSVTQSVFRQVRTRRTMEDSAPMSVRVIEE